MTSEQPQTAEGALSQEDQARMLAFLPDRLQPYLVQITDLDTYMQAVWSGVMFAASIAAEVEQWMTVVGKKAGVTLPALPKLSPHLLEFARREEAGSLPYGNSLAMVRLCAILESALDEVIVERLHQVEAGSWSPKEAIDIKTNLFTLVSPSAEERLDVAATAFKEKLGTSRGGGIGKFQAALERLELGGRVNDDIARSIGEVVALRNAIVHNDRHADARLIALCNTLGLTVGQPIDVVHDQLKRYMVATAWYLADVFHRTLLARGHQDRHPEVDAVVNYKAQCLRDHDRWQRGEVAFKAATGKAAQASGG